MKRMFLAPLGGIGGKGGSGVGGGLGGGGGGGAGTQPLQWPEKQPAALWPKLSGLTKAFR